MMGIELVASPDDEARLLAVVRELVAERHTADRAASATLDSAFDRDLGLDSLAVAELVARVENTFGVSLERGVLGSAAVPRDLLAALRRAPRRGLRRPTPARHDAPAHVDRIPHEIATITEALSWHARTHPDRIHLRILGEGPEEPEEEVSYGDLRRDAATVAAALLARDLRPGDTVAIMLPTGRDYFASFTGVLVAGGVPVPIYPPARRAQLADHLRRQVRILDNARAGLLITNPEAALLARLLRSQVESVRHVLTPAELGGHGEASPAGRRSADIALLQYTSGSTSDPKGVVLTHANLLVNIRAMGRFAERFTPYGLRRDALAPVYGLAEAGVGLTFPPVGREPVVDRVAREKFLRSGRAIPAADDDPDPLRFVACGRPIPGHEIRVVDAAGNELGDRREGRIEFRGPSATTGYFRNPQATRALVQRGWLNTGDLGYLDDTELYVTGRGKDLIIRAGRNLHPEELEHAVGDIPGIRQGCVAVFATPAPAGGTERLVVLAETRHTGTAALADLRTHIVTVTVELLGTPPDDVVLAPPGSVPKTSSGKIRRAASRERYERGAVGAQDRPVWWQLARFAVRGVLPRLRRVVRVSSSATFAAWCWSLLLLVGLPTMVALAVLPGPAARQAVAHRAARSLGRLSGTRIVVAGADRLAQLPDCVVVANHPSYLDGIAMAAALPGRYTFVAAEVFATKPLSGFFLRRIGTRFVERTDREQGVADTRRLTEAARGGERLLLFPEGGLSPVPGLRPFRMGAFVIAASAGLPVVPVAISGTRAMMWPDRGVLIRRGALRLVVGEPIVPAGDGWDAAVALERAARSAIVEHCGEPDLGE